MDFFAGSGTTGQAVLEYNKKKNTNIQFILVTNNENNICTSVTLPRLKKVITGYTDYTGVSRAGTGGSLHFYRETDQKT